MSTALHFFIMNKFISPPKIERAIEILLNGGLVAFPTETVYGLGGNAYSDKIVASIFACKNRSEFNPLNVCYRSLEQACDDVEITETAQAIAEKFLPGPLTLLLKRKPHSRLSLLCSAGLNSIGVRIPSNSLAIKLLSALKFPLAAPSANRSGNLSHTTAQAVAEDLDGVAILDGGKCNFGIESTIIDCSGKKLVITRQGAITDEEIAEKCNIPIKNISFKEKPKKFATNKIIVLNAVSANTDDAFLAFGKTIENICKKTLNLSEKGDINEAAANFFSMLQELDKSDAKRICVAPIPQEGMGKAINNRLSSLVKQGN